tara:strand:- start:2 stop:388 length:387 start_codon:yes stop_codon:yes gene_type:complete
MRDTLLTAITANVASSNVSVSSELPWIQGDTPLYSINMKKFYLDEEQISKTVYIETLDDNKQYQTETIMEGFLEVDAKNPLSDIDTVISGILASKSAIADTTIAESSYTTETENDRITYTFEFRFITY